MTLTDVIQKMRMLIRVKHLAYSTEKSYVHWVGRYAAFARGLNPDMTHEAKLERFLTHLAKSDVSASTQNQAFNAIIFLYREVLGIELSKVNGLRAKKYQHVRIAPPIEQTGRILAGVKDTGGYPLGLIVRLLYGCGLRLNEALDLRLKDVLPDEGRLVIRAAKGCKDRVVPLPPSLLEPIRKQIEIAKALWKRDSVDRLPVALPHLLSYKYPAAKYEQRWYWLFPAAGTCRHPRTGEIVRWRVHPTSVQSAVRSSALAAVVPGVSPHCLRHAYATHAIEAGNSIRDVQEVLGHAHLDTTMGYIHADSCRVRSPLERLVGVA